ncbi:Multicopper oxidase, type 3 precursor [Bradyrhizobium sp. STM 3843]|uniref:multicopper oxidase family protein n=1 Tax=Bradyrhizobium sp. STM 3843 TaxID=551947 RepID=UPI00024040B2|nr:multicopper oxidase family protein [Bradyrhizobium sp. STM 3843]CCE11596.1 Multicopper oxidase, type 3 precursor [Bradyrhizobium sp. STM 3843]
MTTYDRDREMRQALPRLSRRTLLRGAQAGAVSLLAARTMPLVRAQTTQSEAADYKISIAPTSIEIAPGKVIKTTAYNGSVPGPALRLKEGRAVRIDVSNESGYPNLIHWHGLMIPATEDGATEEGSPIIAPGKTLTYSYTPKPSGTRWYHSHAMAMTDLNKSTYTGEFGFLIVEPAAGDPGSYDREVLLAAHHWDGHWVSLQDIKKGPPPDNGLEVMYHAATLGDRMLGHGEPIRVREGERVLFRLLNASGNMGISLALPGHRFKVLALDGNPVPTSATVDVLKLDVAERADVIVEMNNPGIWVFGSTDDEDRNMGMGVVVEYANRSGEPAWSAPANPKWDCTAFGRPGAAAAAPDETIGLKFEKIPGGRGGYNRWTINGKSWPETNPLFTVTEGKRYRLLLNNNSGDEHPVHLHRHSFEITKVGDKPTSGVIKDTISLPRFSTAEIDFVADDPGATFFHCHHQDHMDEGFAGLITYR